MKIQQENELHNLRMGSFRQGYRSKEFRSVKKKVENGVLKYEDKPDIMAYLIMEKGDTGNLGFSPEDSVKFVAYTLYLTAGNCNKIADGQTNPKDAKSMWDTPVIELWKTLSGHTQERKEISNTYKTMLNTINNQR